MSKTWFITGSNRGIGKMIVQAALEAGDQVVATGRKLDSLVSVHGRSNDFLSLVEMDVLSSDQIDKAIREAISRFGKIDVLVNNAGYGQLGQFETISPLAIEQQFATNVFGLMQVTRAALPHMREKLTGHFINISSIGGVVGFDGASVYCASKFAVEGFSESMMLELERFNIRTTIVEPGFFRTDFLDNSSVNYGDLEVPAYNSAIAEQRKSYDQYSHAQPGDPKKLAKAIIELAHQANPPLRFVAGADALTMSRESLDARNKELELFANISESMQHD